LNEEHFQEHRWLSKEQQRDYSFFGTPTPQAENKGGSVTHKGLEKDNTQSEQE
jgi:hypothetical protein